MWGDVGRYGEMDDLDRGEVLGRLRLRARLVAGDEQREQGRDGRRLAWLGLGLGLGFRVRVRVRVSARVKVRVSPLTLTLTCDAP